jgi:hypothetical protein
MMASVKTTELRRAAMTRLAGASAVTSLVAASSIFPQTVPASPAYPHIRMGAPSIFPLKAACVDGTTGIFSVHAFSRGIDTGGALSMTGEDHAGNIGDAIAGALDGQVLEMDSGTMLHVRWTGSQLMRDGAEADVYHAVVNFSLRTLD